MISGMTGVLIVEEEPDDTNPLPCLLRQEQFDVTVIRDDPDSALSSLDADLVVLEVTQPGKRGVELCRQVRLITVAPIIMLGQAASEIDTVLALEIGADDYVVKPYSARELLARISAILRRSTQRPTVAAAAESVLLVGPIRMDNDRHLVTIADQPVRLPLKEYQLLELLLHNNHRTLTRNELLDRIWGHARQSGSKTLDVHVKRLRDKIEQHPGRPRLLRTVRNVGYRLDI